MSEIVECTSRELANQLGRFSTPVTFIIFFFKFAILFLATVQEIHKNKCFACVFGLFYDGFRNS